MERRSEAQRRYDSGEVPRFDPAREGGEWACAGVVPPVIEDRRVEITGPTERKMLINAFNSGAKLNDRTATLFVRPRGWHLPESHILIDGEPAIGCLVDFGLYFYHNHAAFCATHGGGFGPFFYLPKMEHSREAKIWNSVFERAEKHAGIGKGSIGATVLIETLPAVFQVDEILYELRDHSAGLNCGRWDYIFRYVKTFRAHPDHLLPDPSPTADNPVANEAALELIRKDKLREVQAGHDGTWAAHPGLIPAITEYLAAWLTGTSSVPLYNLMEDAATAEISRVQNWQWLRYEAILDGDGVGVRVTKEVFARVVEEEMARIEREVGKERFEKGMYREACKIFVKQCMAATLDDFLTLDAYNCIVLHHPEAPAKLQVNVRGW
ncbi:hypothetical protein QJS10_CPA06g01360 [Acorus calamus]|uniref:Malate synthase n=1 Tax=Acorus calamus TaxID=4465 RepID=A0AAV9EM44_ACOCL|nr:hypothetical protein QJS10_CPA06g01360 [Acorus calamus]